MGFGNRDDEDEMDEMREAGAAKNGEPVVGACPNCGRAKLVKGKEDQKRRCTKCAWCVEDNAFDNEFARYLFT